MKNWSQKPTNKEIWLKRNKKNIFLKKVNKERNRLL